MLIHLGHDGLTENDGVTAYSRSGDVWLHCPERSVPLTHTGDVFSFALFPDASRMGVIRHLNRDSSSRAIAILEEIDLGTGQTARKEQLPATLYGYEVVSTCGTAMLLGNHMESRKPGSKIAPRLETEVTDLVTGRALESSNFNNIRCTADRSVVLRKLDEPFPMHATLFIGDTGDSVLAPKDVGSFDVSKNGKYIAYTASDRVCAIQPAVPSSAPMCADRFWNRGRLDVSDSGRVWLTGDSLTGCPGVNDKLPTFTCDAIFVWNPAQGTPRLLAYGYVDPFGVPLSLGQQIISRTTNWQQKPARPGPD
jgi:hypothetical protein